VALPPKQCFIIKDTKLLIKAPNQGMFGAGCGGVAVA